MEEYFELIPKLFVPENLIKIGGLGLLLFIVFAETGLFVGFFLPGDSLLFTAGILSSTHVLNVNIVTLMVGLNIAAILGNMTGYYFGKRVGPKLFTRDDSLIFKKRYVAITQSFYNRHGGKALILGRFLPIIRTFAPILSGVIKLEIKVFLAYTIIGSVLWTSTLTLSAYYLANAIPNLISHLGLVVLALISITTIPIISTYLKEKKIDDKNDKLVNSIASIILLVSFFLPLFNLNSFKISYFDILFNNNFNFLINTDFKYVFIFIPVFALIILIGTINDQNYILPRKILFLLPFLFFMIGIIAVISKLRGDYNFEENLAIGFWLMIIVCIILASMYANKSEKIT